MEVLHIKTDKEKNRLYFVLKGYFLQSEVDLVVNKLCREIFKLKPGFDVIVDIKDFKASSEDLKDLILVKLEKLRMSGSRNFINVTGTNRMFEVFGKYKFSSLIDSGKFIRVSSVNEGKDILDHINQLNDVCLS